MAILIDTQIRNNLYASGSITASLGFLGNLFGSSSYAATASFALNSGGGTSLTTGSTYPITSSWAVNATSATNASTVTVNNTSTDEYYYPTFVSTTSGDRPIYIDTTGIRYNMSTNNLSGSNLSVSASVHGNVTGTSSWATNATTATNADTVDNLHASSFQRTISTGSLLPITSSWAVNATTATSATSATTAVSATSASYAKTASNANSIDVLSTASDGYYYPSFFTGLGGYRQIYIDTDGIKYNPATNDISGSNLSISASFWGNSVGTASWAVNATNAATAAGVTISTNSTNAYYYPTFVTGTSGQRIVYVDTTGILYNPSTNNLSGSNFSVSGSFFGNLIGTASWATNAITAAAADWATQATSALSAISATSASYASISDTAYKAEDVSVGTISSDNWRSFAFFLTDTTGYQNLYTPSNDSILFNPSRKILSGSGLMITASFYGDISGTSSWATNAVSAISASYAPGSPTISASYATTASFALNATNASTVTVNNTSTNEYYYPTFVSTISGDRPIYIDTTGIRYNMSTNNISGSNLSISASVHGNVTGTSSWATNAVSAISASYAPGSPTLSSSYATTASFALNAGSSGGTTLTTGSLYPITSSFALTSSVINVISASGEWKIYPGSLGLTFQYVSS